MSTLAGLQECSLNAMWCAYLSVGATLSSADDSANIRTNVGHAFLNSRFYDSSRGQFLSEDPVFLALGTPQAEALSQQHIGNLLSDPQQLNAYSYSRDNPIVYKDPTANAFGVDDAAGFFGGGFIGAVSYVGVSIIARDPVTWGGMSGSFLTGVVIGWGLVNTPETLGVSPPPPGKRIISKQRFAS